MARGGFLIGTWRGGARYGAPGAIRILQIPRRREVNIYCRERQTFGGKSLGNMICDCVKSFEMGCFALNGRLLIAYKMEGVALSQPQGAAGVVTLQSNRKDLQSVFYKI